MPLPRRDKGELCANVLTMQGAGFIPQGMKKTFTKINGLAEIASRYDVVLSDIWGVVHNGLIASPDACEALRKFRDTGTVVLITNAPRPSGPIVAQLDQLGAPRSTYDAIVTSGDVTMALIAARGADKLYHIGPAHDVALLDEAAKRMAARPASVALKDADYVLCTGLFHDEVEVPADYDAALAQMKARGLTMICANPDIVVHRGETLIYCAGALGERYREMGGETIYAGKPYAPIYAECLRLAAGLRGAETPLPRVLAIGDAVRTDVAGALAQNIDVLMISNGLHREEMHDVQGILSEAEAHGFLAKGDHWPTYVMQNLRW